MAVLIFTLCAFMLALAAFAGVLKLGMALALALSAPPAAERSAPAPAAAPVR